MGYSFTSPEVVRALVRAKRRGVDVRVVLHWKANTGKNNNASKAAMNLLASTGIPVRTVSAYNDLFLLSCIYDYFRKVIYVYAESECSLCARMNRTGFVGER